MKKILASFVALVALFEGVPVMAQNYLQAPEQESLQWQQGQVDQAPQPRQRRRIDFDRNTGQYFYRDAPSRQYRSRNPRQAQQYYEPSVGIQTQILDDGAAQGQQAISIARQLCEENGGTFVGSRVRQQVVSDVKSRIESRPQQRFGRGRNGWRGNTIQVNLFGPPRLPQWYQNDVEVRVDTSNACQ